MPTKFGMDAARKDPAMPVLIVQTTPGGWSSFMIFLVFKMELPDVHIWSYTYDLHMCIYTNVCVDDSTLRKLCKIGEVN